MIDFGLTAPPYGGCVFQWLDWAWRAFAQIFVMDFGKYAIAASLAFVLLWIVFREPMKRRKIQKRTAPASQLRREFLWSLSSVIVYGLVGIGIVLMIQGGWSRLYLSIDQEGWGYWAASLAAMIVLHDAWFYWTHRMMHHPRLFRFFHLTHHRSHNPSPWAAYSFAPPEALVQALFTPIALLLMPLHPSVLVIWGLHQIIRNVLGHSGYELFPRGTATHWFGKWINTHTHHDLHHSKGSGNYSLYFNWWDRAMGTLREDYEATFAAVTNPVRPEIDTPARLLPAADAVSARRRSG